MQLQKTRMNKRKFRIGELAKKLKVKKFVIRFWEKEFDLESNRSDGGQRFYSQEDLNTFTTIKDLLYNQKFTIPGAKNQLDFGKNVIEETENSDINPATKTNLIAQEQSEPVKTIETIKFVEKIKLVEKLIEKFVLKLGEITV